MSTEKNTVKNKLPPGQFEHSSFDRFGLGHFANKLPHDISDIEVAIKGDIQTPVTLTNEFSSLPRCEQTSDFHCVTTWSSLSIKWQGIRFREFYETLIVPMAKPEKDASFVVFRGHDGYCCAMQLSDLMADDVLLVDQLNNEPLNTAHGAPLRLVAPAHYGYKSVKHIKAIEFWRDNKHYQFAFPYPNLMDHPRARVAFEERARFIPNWIIRPLYKVLMPFARRKQRKALTAYLNKK